jgi:hypothetical protein
MAKDLFHNEVRRALEKEGWLITNDPLFIKSLSLQLATSLRR